jgi:hypothetical protein
MIASGFAETVWFCSLLAAASMSSHAHGCQLSRIPETEIHKLQPNTSRTPTNAF